jgi:hypothetical protein
MEIEDEEQPSPFEDDDLIALVFEGDVRLGRIKPAILYFEMLYGSVKVVQVFVSQEIIVDNVPLSPSVVE